MNRSSASIGNQGIILDFLEPGLGRSLIPLLFQQEGPSMLSRSKYAQLAAVAALTVLFGANASTTTASAQAGIQLAQADTKDMQKSRKGDVRSSTNARMQADRSDRKQNVQRSSSTRNVMTQREPTRAFAQDHRKKKTVTKTTTRKVVVRRDHNRRVIRDRVVIRSSPSTSVGFVVLGPRVVYRAYGSGWCRGLHRGRHWVPRIGWHAGRHFGAFRC
jgi:hypothetical protein